MKMSRDFETGRIDTGLPQDSVGQVTYDPDADKSWMYVQNAGVDLAVVGEFAARHTDGVRGHASGTVATAMVDTVNNRAVCLGVWEAAVPAGSYGYVQKTGDRATLVGSTVPTVGEPLKVVNATFVAVIAVATESGEVGYSLDGTAVRLDM